VDKRERITEIQWTALAVEEANVEKTKENGPDRKREKESVANERVRKSETE